RVCGCHCVGRCHGESIGVCVRRRKSRRIGFCRRVWHRVCHCRRVRVCGCRCVGRCHGESIGVCVRRCKSRRIGFCRRVWHCVCHCSRVRVCGCHCRRGSRRKR